MATSGSKTYAFTDYDDLVFNWTRTDVNEAANTSTIGWSLQLVSKEYGAISASQQKFLSVRVNGTAYPRYDINLTIGNNTTRTLTSGQTTITHNLNGTCTFSFSVELGANITFNNKFIGTVTFSGTGELNRINRRSTVTCTNAYIEEEMRININSYDSSFTHTLTYSFRGATGTIETKTSATTISWYIPADFWDLLNDATEAECLITCQTYSGTTLLGSTTAAPKILTGNVPPTISASFADTSGSNWDLTGGSSRSIRYYTGSSLWYSISATAARGATIADYKVVYGSKTYTGQEGYLDNSDYLTATVAVTDSRGVKGTQVVELNMADYFYPTIVLRVSKPTASGEAELEFQGTHFNQSFGAQNNSFTLEYRFKEEGDSYGSWRSVTPTEQTSTTYYSAVDKSSLDYTSAYTFQARITDSLTTVLSEEITVTSIPVFDWDAQDFAFNVPVSIQGDTIQDFVIEQGTEAMGSNGTWYWRKWKSGRADCYGLRNYGNTAVTTAWGNLYRSAIFTQDLPSGLFKSGVGADYIGINLMTGTYGGWIAMHEQVQPSEYETGSFIIVRPASATIGAAYISFHCIGRWK